MIDSKASSSSSSSLLLHALFFCMLCSTTTTAFNITRILSNTTDFSTFNTLLTQTGLAKEINSRQSITVLAVSNGAIGNVSGEPIDTVKKILSTHVILDYFDETKLQNIKNKSSILTTLYQTSGSANDQQGFLNVTKTSTGIMFGSAVKGAPLDASLQGSVASQPYNISVLEVSAVIEAPGIGSSAPPPPPAPKKAPAAPPPTSATTPSKSPAPAAEEPAAPDVDAPTPSAEAPDADADAPLSSPPQLNSTPDVETPAQAGSSHLHVSGVFAVSMGLMACIMAF